MWCRDANTFQDSCGVVLVTYYTLLGGWAAYLRTCKTRVYGSHIPFIHPSHPSLPGSPPPCYPMCTGIAFHPSRGPTLFSISFFSYCLASRYAHDTSAIVDKEGVRTSLTSDSYNCSGLPPNSGMLQENGRERSRPRRSAQGLMQGTRFHVVGW